MESLAAAAASLGVPAGSLIFLLSMLLSPLLSAAHSHVRGTAARHLASLLLGLAMCCWNYGFQQLHFLLAPVTVAYALTRLTRRHAGPVVLVASFAFLIYWCARVLAYFGCFTLACLGRSRLPSAR